MELVIAKLSRKGKDLKSFISYYEEKNTHYLKINLVSSGNKILSIFKTEEDGDLVDVVPNENQKIEGYFSLKMDIISEIIP